MVQGQKITSNDKPTWKYLESEYIPDSYMTIDEQLPVFRRHCPLWVHIY